MPETFEEFAGRHIDGLYQGALFLNAGEELPAEDSLARASLVPENVPW